MKIFISFKYTGENKEELKENMRKICAASEKENHEHYCTLFEDNSFFKKSKKQIFEYAFKKIDEADIVLVILKSEEKSEGMLLEVGYVLGERKKLILAVQKDIKNTYLRELADNTIEFNNIEDLTTKSSKIKI
ncbi:MAG: nucleoside 2-deoxyribosyltransferase [Candidatus Pacearchaeota archaeon]|nr:nucleoside 2-deoxyribosyltransferase [Candidatus Pacearchaeota archaeon]